ncbi:serine/threonine-protein phosphatase [Arcanobacterium haemolyticum]|nr:serine/threonine-protein phosphatase [Arcanobacterium haemolyticum]
MSIQLRYAAFSDIGLVRSSNQDAGYASSHLLVLADGMGGAAAGDVASSVTVGYLAGIDDDVHTADELLPTLRSAIAVAHDDLIRRVDEDPEIAGLGTTCIAILRSNNKLAMVHVGDSRAYLLRNGEMTQVTKDHTLVQFLVDHGQITPEEAEHHPKRNVIMRNVGDMPGDVELDESVREAIIGDRWLLSSDGLFGVVARDTIEHTLRTYTDLAECGNHLIELALAAGAPDNVTVVLADVVDGADSSVGLQSQAPIVVGSAALDPGWHSRGGNSAAAQAARLFSQPQEPVEVVDEPAERPRPRIVAKLAATIAVVAILAAGIFGGYRWTQSQYYVAENDGFVTIYRGIPQSIGSLSLSSVERTTTIRVSDLQQVARDRLTSPIVRGSLAEAEAVVENISQQLTPEAAASASPSEAPTQGDGGTGTPVPTPSPVEVTAGNEGATQ